jgi:hypothetical protein
MPIASVLYLLASAISPLCKALKGFWRFNDFVSLAAEKTVDRQRYAWEAWICIVIKHDPPTRLKAPIHRIDDFHLTLPPL